MLSANEFINDVSKWLFGIDCGPHDSSSKVESNAMSKRSSRKKSLQL